MSAHEEFEIAYNYWKANNRWGRAPRKPPGHDLYMQGKDPLRTIAAGSIPCQGGNLVDHDRVSVARPEPLESPSMEQIDFL